MKRDKEYYVRKLTEFEIKEKHGKKIAGAFDMYTLLQHYGKMNVEYFLTITLDCSHKVIDIHEISKGIIDRALVHPREVYRSALMDNAKAIIIAHNHPSGETLPSDEDNNITKRLKEAGEIIGIEILDHIIIATNGFHSYAETGELLFL